MNAEQKSNYKFKKLPVINAAKGSMLRLFQNLVNNAVKYHERVSKPRVNICIGEDDNFWYIEIEDNGIAIEPEYADKIFKIFQSLHDKEEYRGSRIGLAV